tara:strand:+ start:193 stop:399 length:207 start_codon:yes stop_codon:yes gene_type:complete
MSDLEELQELSNKTSRSTVAVIDAMTQRGAFKGEELSTIGGLRDQCIQIIQICENLAQDAAMEDEDEE